MIQEVLKSNLSSDPLASRGRDKLIPILSELSRKLGFRYSPNNPAQNLGGVRIQEFDNLLKRSQQAIEPSPRQKDPNLDLLSPEWLKHKFDLVGEFRRLIEGYLQRVEQGQSVEQVLDNCCLEFKGNIIGERNELFLGKTIIPNPIAFKVINGVREIVGMGDCVIDDMYDEETREGIPYQIWRDCAKPHIYAMAPGSIMVIDSCSGPSMKDRQNKNHQIFQESQTLFILKGINREGEEYLQGITVVNDLDLSEHEDFLRRTHLINNYLGGVSRYDRILNVARSIGILYAEGSGVGFSDGLNLMRSVKKSPWLRARPKKDLKTGKYFVDKIVTFEEGLADIKRVESDLVMDSVSEELVANRQAQLKINLPLIIKQLELKGISSSSEITLEVVEALLRNSDLAYETVADVKKMLLKMSKIAREGGGEELLVRELSQAEQQIEKEDIESKPACPGESQQLLGYMSKESWEAYKNTPLELRPFFCTVCGSCKGIIEPGQVVLPGQICPVKPSCGAIRPKEC